MLDNGRIEWFRKLDHDFTDVRCIFQESKGPFDVMGREYRRRLYRTKQVLRGRVEEQLKLSVKCQSIIWTSFEKLE